MKNLFYLIAYLCFSFMLSSCEKEENVISQQQQEKTRVSFNSTKDFYDTYQALSKMDCDEQIAWINSCGIKEPLYDSIENCTDEIMLDMPRAFQALFNKQLEVEVNDSVILFSEGKMYVKSIQNKLLTTPTLYGEVFIDKGSTVTTRTEYQNPYGKIGQSFLCEISLSAGWRHQYVHELKSVIVNLTRPGGNIHLRSNLYLVLKFEYKKNKGWREATAELRNIYVNFNFYKHNFLQVNRTQEILLTAQDFDSYNIPSGPGHIIDISGTIRHEVIGRTDSRRENQWTVTSGYKPWYPY